MKMILTLLLVPLWLHKLAVWPLLPVGLSVVLGLAAICTRRRALGIAAVVVLCAASMPVTGNLLIWPLERSYPQLSPEECVPADAVVVLGGGSDPGYGKARIDWSEAADRFEGGMDVFATGRVGKLVFTRGKMPWSDGPDEGMRLREEALRRGVPAGSIVLTDGDAGNTADEAREVRRLVSRHGWRKLILVTSAYHMRRAMRLFSPAAPQVIAYPVDYHCGGNLVADWTSWMPQANGLSTSEDALREYFGLLWYTFTRH